MKFTVRFVFFLSLIFAFSCKPNDFTEKNKQVLLDSLNYVILNSDTISISIKDIYKINELLNKSIIEYNSAIDALSNNFDPKNVGKTKIQLENYRKQLIPMLNYKNEKVIWINCLCNDANFGPKDDWKKTIIKVMDGGDCFFNVFINVSKNNWSAFNVNDNG